MCGIAGLLSWNTAPDAAVVAAMIDRLAHRGPDAEGLVALGPLVLGHRRLSVIDTAESNNQPLFDQSGELTIAFNGEIYNYRELRRELEGSGAVFRTRGDTEVILEAYRHWGLDCLARFNGMFAFGLWDRPRRRLLLARDRVGEKPLFYARQSAGGLAFASEPRALRACPGVGNAVDPIGLAHYLTLNYTLGEHTLIKGMRRLSPGHYLLIEEGREPVEQSYWNLAERFIEKRHFASEQAAADELCALVDDAVRLRLVADVPLGAFLSGGVDSSAVAAAMAHALPPGQVHTFSLGFGIPTFDEIDAARAVATHLGLDHKDRIVTADVEHTWAALIAAADEPLADTSAIPTYRLAAFARQFVTVALSGDGADECFVGYETYAADRLHRALSWMPAPLARGLYRGCRPAAASELLQGQPRLQAQAFSVGTGSALSSCARLLAKHLLRGGQTRDHAAAMARDAGVAGGGSVSPVRAPLCRGRGLPLPGSGQLCRHQDLARRRYSGQGRPCDNGPFAGGSCAAAGPSAGRVCRRAAAALEAQGAAQEASVQAKPARPAAGLGVERQEAGLQRADLAMVLGTLAGLCQRCPCQ